MGVGLGDSDGFCVWFSGAGTDAAMRVAKERSLEGQERDRGGGERGLRRDLGSETRRDRPVPDSAPTSSLRGAFRSRSRRRAASSPLPPVKSPN